MTTLAIPAEQLHTQFLTILPRIEVHARVYFRGLQRAAKEEAIAETCALAWKWFRRLVERGKDVSKFPSAIATYAARAVKNGRRVCGQERARDVLSARARRRHGFTVQALPGPHNPRSGAIFMVGGQREMDCYEERLQDTRTPPDKAAAFRIDFKDWRKRQKPKDRRIIDEMAKNERTKDLAKKYGVSRGRISQKRSEFHDDWQEFHGELPASVA